ncbi:helix-turn-helix domain-containing protein [Kitasatospora sp. NPDC008050]|uniref:helix-turn-helix domain-containing protein n=1 Tax=Kitasatospora sp. NPDC008050 TaxID=3364021 RepID=UPI0036ED63C9
MLRQLREDAGLTAEQVGIHLTCHASKVGRIENGRSGVRMLDLNVMLDLYGLKDQEARDRLVELAKESKKRGWWRVYDDVMKPGLAEYISLESAASQISTFQPMLIPGLLQTEDYVRAIMQGGRKLPSDEIERRVRLRLERQEWFDATGAHMWAVIGEAALRNQVGGPPVMREQVKRLLAAADGPEVTLQVLPFDVGAHPAIGSAFVILSFQERTEGDVILVEAMTSSIYLETEEQLDQYKFAFNHLRAAALAPRQTQEFLQRTLTDYSAR